MKIGKFEEPSTGRTLASGDIAYYDESIKGWNTLPIGAENQVLKMGPQLLCHFDGNNGAKEIVDSGDTGHVVTQVGNATLSVAQKRFGVSSLYAADTTDYLSVPDSADWDFGTGDFTIDFWVWMSKVASQPLIELGDEASGGFWVMYNNTLQLYIVDNTNLTFAWTPVINHWYHVAVVKTSGDYKCFVDGVQIGSTIANSQSIAVTDVVKIGANPGQSYEFEGYLDEVRISKGIARWTANFIPQTTPYTSDSYTKLLLHMESHDVCEHIPTFIGTAQISTAQSKFGGASLLLDGNSDSVTVPDSNEWTFGAGNFTIDLQARFDNVSSDKGLIGQYVDGDNFWGLFWSQSDTNLYFFYLVGGVSFLAQYIGLWSPSVNTWYHIAVERDGSTCRMFVNGSALTVTEYNAFGTLSALSTPLSIGRVGSRYMAGYIDEVRVSKGIVRWASSFQAPVAAYTLTPEWRT